MTRVNTSYGAAGGDWARPRSLASLSSGAQLPLGWLLAGLATAAWCLVGQGCAEDGGDVESTVLVEIGADDAVQEATERLQFALKGADSYAGLLAETPPVDGVQEVSGVGFPYTVALQPRAEDDSRVVELYVRALDSGGAEVSWGRVQTSYVQGGVGYSKLQLGAYCVESSRCQESQTCGGIPACIDAQVSIAQEAEDAVPLYVDPGGQCAALPCEYGTCQLLSGEAVCVCDDDHEGEDCASERDPCLELVCANGGECQVDANGDAGCVCPAPYGGAGCETDLVDDCGEAPCEHGTCSDGIDSFVCACEAPYAGERCDEYVTSCADEPCQHGGTCEELEEGYQCVCAADYEGVNCEQVIDDCSGVTACDPGSCIDGVATFTCSCPAGYSTADAQACADPTFHAPTTHVTADSFFSLSVASAGHGMLGLRVADASNGLWLYDKGGELVRQAGPSLLQSAGVNQWDVQGEAFGAGRAVVAFGPGFVGLVNFSNNNWTAVRTYTTGFSLGSNGDDTVFVNPIETGTLEVWGASGFVQTVASGQFGGAESLAISVTPDGKALLFDRPSGGSTTWYTVRNGVLSDPVVAAEADGIDLATMVMDVHNDNFAVFQRGEYEFSFRDDRLRSTSGRGAYAGQVNGTDGDDNVVTFAVNTVGSVIDIASYDSGNGRWTHRSYLREEQQLGAVDGADASDVGAWVAQSEGLDMAHDGNGLFTWWARSASGDGTLCFLLAARYTREAGLSAPTVLGSSRGSGSCLTMARAEVDVEGHGLIGWLSSTGQVKVTRFF